VLRWLKDRRIVHTAIALFFVLPVLLLLVSGLADTSWILSYAKLKFDSLEASTLDYRYIYFRRAPANPQLVFLTIDATSVALDASDEQTIAASRPLTLIKSGYPFPREVYADICDLLIGAGAKAVAFDIFFLKPTPADAPFHEALEKYRNKVVIGMNFSDDFEAGYGTTSNSARLILPPDTLLPSQDPLDDHLGYLNFWPDPDGSVRAAQYRTNAEYVSQEEGAEKRPKLYSLAARTLQKAGHGDIIPDDLKARLMRFAHLTKFPTFSIYQIFEPGLWTKTFHNGEFFKDKIVLVGPKGDWAKDQLVTPFGQMNGAEIHLNAMNALLQNDFLHPASRGVIFLCVLAAGAFASLLAVTVIPFSWRFLAGLGVFGGYTAFTIWGFDGPGWLMPVVAPMGVFSGTMGVGFVYDFVLNQIEKLRLRTTFERYNSKNVVKYLLDHVENYEAMLAGTRQPVTALFSDIRGFTTMAEEAADSQKLVAKLNEYLTAMVDIVFKFDGTLDCFMGDGIMAVWGNTPFNFGPKGDAVRAVQSGLAMIVELRKLNAKWMAEGGTEWKIGIGLNHGDVIVGDIGSKEHSEFAAIGDAVNLASRIEGLTKEYQVELLIGETVANLVREEFHLRSVDLVQVKGKKKPVEVFAVLGEKSTALKLDDKKFLMVYEEGIDCFRRREFVRATELFTEAQKMRPNDFLCGYFIEGCEEFVENPPDEGWTGVRVMTKK
jgi:adenylate cyclase